MAARRNDHGERYSRGDRTSGLCPAVEPHAARGRAAAGGASSAGRIPLLAGKPNRADPIHGRGSGLRFERQASNLRPPGNGPYGYLEPSTTSTVNTAITVTTTRIPSPTTSTQRAWRP